MKSKTAIVTGGARGIGRAICERLAAEAQIYLVDIDLKQGGQTADQLKAQGFDVIFLQADVADEAQVKSVAEYVQSICGKLDWLVNNAGVSSFAAFPDVTVEQFDRVIAVNLRSAFLLAKCCVSMLKASGRGAIVNIASTRAFMSEPGNEAYAASKAGLLGLTHALANSLGPDIRVNAICPGWINVSQDIAELTEADKLQHPVGRVGVPEDIADLTAFLLSPAAGFITGQEFVVDGGMTKKMIYV